MKIYKKLSGIYDGPLGKILESMDDDMGRVRFTGWACLSAFVVGFLLGAALL
jgi:hypothetical protein